MSNSWNKYVQKLFWWKNTNVDPLVGNVEENKSEGKINLALLNTHENLKNLYNEINLLKDFYISKMMINRIIDDALNPTAENDDLFKVEIINDDDTVNEMATKEVNQLKKNMNLERLIIDISSDILAFGSHYLRLDVNTIDTDFAVKGIINIHDDVDPTSIIPIWRDNEILYFNKIEKGKIIKKQNFEYVYFGFSNERIKVKTKLDDENSIYFRIGNGLLKPALQSIRTLYLLEGLVYVNLIKKVSKQPIIGVSVPESISADQAINIAKSYEKLINSNLNNINIDFNNIKETLENILENTNKVKVIPDWGNKGQLQKQDLEIFSDLEDIFTKIEDLRNIIVKTCGFSPEILESSLSRNESVQNNVRYSKKLKTFQTSLKNGLIHLFLIHLKNCGYDVSSRNIKITFSNVLNIEDLEKIEYLSMVIETMGGIKDFIDDIADNAEEIGISVNKKSLIKFYNKSFKRLLDEDIFIFSEDDKSDDK